MPKENEKLKMKNEKSQSKNQREIKDLSFEEALEELKAKVELLEEEKLPLEKALEVVEESNRLAKICLEKLDQKISLRSKKGR